MVLFTETGKFDEDGFGRQPESAVLSPSVKVELALAHPSGDVEQLSDLELKIWARAGAQVCPGC